MMKAHPLLALLLLLLVCLASLMFGLLTGSQPLSLAQLHAVLTGQATPLEQLLVLELRLPRLLTALAVGGLLAVAGVLMQLLLRNPLADPYILGLSGGAAFCALLAMLAGWTLLWINLAAFGGALFSSLLVFGLAWLSGPMQPTRLLLTGIVLASGWGAGLSLLLSITPERALPGMLYWLMGDLSYARQPSPLLLLLGGSLLILAPFSRALNLLARGQQQAQVLGVAVRPLETLLFISAALITATAVASVGSLGFIGLVVPHLMRLWIGSDHRWLLPASALAGASLLMLADTAARSLLAPQQLPVGVMTALIGVPVFLYLLHRQAKT
ncbi:FecCD family ABC transporter permease [Marinospirillum sp.]|uniref:FecCD family ABC transporter permease n=1 Tax=Marinospirillum sp. TaxID=2183934 RepID=UPI003A89F4EC